MDKWRKCRLGDLIHHRKGFAFKSASYSDNGETVIVRVSDTTDSSIDLDSCKRISENEALDLEEYKLLEDDIVIATVGSWADNPKSIVGKVIKVPSEANGALLNQNAVRIRARSYIFQKFAYYRLKAKDFSGYLLNGAQGSANQASITLKDIFSFDFLLPPPAEQKAIAQVLSSLDDKIDLLHRQNKTLEAIAETLFRQWFIEGIGDSWKSGKIEDLFVLQRGFDLPTRNRVEGIYPIFAASGFSGYHSEFKVKAPGVTTGRSGLLGKAFLVLDDFWPLNTSLYVREFRIGTPIFSYFLLSSLDLEAFNAGSAVPTLNRNHVHELRISIPPADLIESFESKAKKNFEKIRFNSIQIQTLENLRDTLLPKLMSGEVRVAVEPD